MKIAIVTGASSGIGREFALKLDGLKLDEIWLAALDKSGLDETAAEMTTPARIFAADLTKDGVDELRKALEEQSPDVRWLVNASGFGKFGRYDEIPVEQSTNMVRLNCEALVAVTELPAVYVGGRKDCRNKLGCGVSAHALSKRVRRHKGVCAQLRAGAQRGAASPQNTGYRRVPVLD